MWKPSKLVLFILMVANSIFAGLSLIFVDWKVFETGQGIYDEIHQPVLFFLLSIFFMFPYVKKLKEESNKKSEK